MLISSETERIRRADVQKWSKRKCNGAGFCPLDSHAGERGDDSAVVMHGIQELSSHCGRLPIDRHSFAAAGGSRLPRPPTVALAGMHLH